MTEYNIYAGPKDRVIYLYTTLRANILEASDIARQELQYEYCACNGTKDYSEALEQATEANSSLSPEEIKDIAFEIYNAWLDSWGEYKAIETSEDNINEEDLIRDYVSSNC